MFTGGAGSRQRRTNALPLSFGSYLRHCHWAL